jgi:threonine dehydratase
MTVTIDDIRAAQQRLEGRIARTPMLHCRTLSDITGAEVWVKFENFQFTAAFKERGALNKLSLLNEAERRVGVIAVSAGNHAQGVAYHAAQLGIPATIVMPVNTPFTKVEHTRKHGARVLLSGDSFAEATTFAYQLKDREGLTLIHPYDDHDVIAGQGTLGIEMLEAAPHLDTLVVPVGGGGLISGIAVAAKALRPDVDVVGVEARMYPSLHAEMRGVEPGPLCGGQTIAEGIAVKQVGRLTFAIASQLVKEVVLVDEADLEQAITLFCNVEKTVAEGAGAAGLAALLAHPARFAGRRVGLVLCGGNIDSRLLASVLTRALVREKRIVSIRIVSDDRPGLLARVSKVIGDLGGNILDVAHNRLALDVPAKGAEFDIQIETRDSRHTEEITEALVASGLPPRLI